MRSIGSWRSHAPSDDTPTPKETQSNAQTLPNSGLSLRQGSLRSLGVRFISSGAAQTSGSRVLQAKIARSAGLLTAGFLVGLSALGLSATRVSAQPLPP